MANPMLIAAVASLLLIVAGLGMPAFTRAFIDSVLLGGDTSVLPPLFAVIGAVVLVSAALTALQQVYLTRTQLVTATIGHAGFLRHLLRLPVTFFAQRSPAELTRRLETNNVVAQILVKDVTTVLVNSVIVLCYAALMWTYDPQLAIIGVAVAMLNIAALRVVTRLRESGVAKVQMDRAKFFAVSFDGLRLIETMKATAAENEYFRRWSGHLAALLESEQRLGVPTAVFATIAPLLAAVNSAVILLVGGLRAVEGHVTIGLLVAFQTLLAGFSRPVTELSGIAGQVQDFAADVARLKDVEGFEPDPIFARPEPKQLRRLDGYVEFDAVTFGYNPLSPPLLTELSFAVGPGRQVALVGGSGSGKSTAARLISCLYSPWSGQIRLDGRPRDEVPRSVLAASVSFVDQEIFLFEGTVRDNVALWDPSIPDEAVIAALQDAAVYDVVAARPGGIHAEVEEAGRNFSGGQRQRLEIARALVRNPSVLVLDEATSALDAETELAIGENVRRRGCACVVIAHRLSTVRDSDEILVLERGQVIERGRHEELARAGGFYAGLIQER
jgi:NHLM bacteriocin system ABC transporter peptidase/ATP-binding protein